MFQTCVMRQNDMVHSLVMLPIVLESVYCSHCQTTHVVENGKSVEGKQHYRCRNVDCSRASFILEYTYCGHEPVVKR